MISLVWDGEQPINQDFGCTDLAVEPFWAPCLSKHFHCGIDIGDPFCKGKPLYAARTGVVLTQSPGILGIKIPFTGEVDYYVHGVYGSGYTPGVAVAQREHIGFFSDVIPGGGSLTGPHLHFERQAGRLNFPGTALDPEPILKVVFGPSPGGDDVTPQESLWLKIVKTSVLGPPPPGITVTGESDDVILTYFNNHSNAEVITKYTQDGYVYAYKLAHLAQSPNAVEPPETEPSKVVLHFGDVPGTLS